MCLKPVIWTQYWNCFWVGNVVLITLSGLAKSHETTIMLSFACTLVYHKTSRIISKKCKFLKNLTVKNTRHSGHMLSIQGSTDTVGFHFMAWPELMATISAVIKASGEGEHLILVLINYMTLDTELASAILLWATRNEYRSVYYFLPVAKYLGAMVSLRQGSLFLTTFILLNSWSILHARRTSLAAS